MAPTLPTDLLQRLLDAESTGAVRLVDEQARPVALLDVLDARTWAHLTDAADGCVYVHELRGSRDLLQASYQELLGLNV
ncbi:hypothetical protein QMK33_19365 [Hymenobacter sp. H14-R3]|uniref:hypothetical protein n=1 Tax=Hymenobacter sp. H14-R3 TaxID=3046308 RepID=UPI0024BA7F58|nr:hypothetical protein [Hymenobacter sp. H14-R3]MDJ0367313.1 hypothetical protein [Hymenobacter sp. H14-R3]